MLHADTHARTQEMGECRGGCNRHLASLDLIKEGLQLYPSPGQPSWSDGQRGGSLHRAAAAGSVAVPSHLHCRSAGWFLVFSNGVDQSPGGHFLRALVDSYLAVSPFLGGWFRCWRPLVVMLGKWRVVVSNAVLPSSRGSAQYHRQLR